jgi:hypothetical protein
MNNTSQYMILALLLRFALQPNHLKLINEAFLLPHGTVKIKIDAVTDIG